jgi:predicted ATP-grasp superfamily ATP-dependent carboligase
MPSDTAAVVMSLTPTALGTIRALAGRRVPVTVIAEGRRGPATYTRHGRKVFDPRHGGPGGLDLLEEVARGFATPPVLFPSSDDDVLLVSRNRERLSASYRFVLPSPESVETLMSKTLFAPFAEKEGLPVPKTCVVRGAADAESQTRRLRFPAILKPSVRSRTWSRRWPKVVLVSTPGEFVATCTSMLEDAEELIAQQIIPGTDSDVHFCLVYVDREGRVRAAYEGRKLRQEPPLFGNTSLAVSHPSTEVRDLAIQTLESAGFRGVGSVEFKRSREDGRYYITEPTVGRVNLQSGLATFAGINIPYLAYCDAAGLALPELSADSREVRWWDERYDLESALYYHRRGELSLGGWLSSLRGRKACALFSWTDPVPFLAMALGLVGRVLRRGRAPGVRVG